MHKLLAIILIVILSPIWLLIIPVQMGVFKNVVFRQQRTGKNLKLFTILKFQTMRTDSGEIPSWGAFLRRTSLDETPQLFNILFGHMNLVGPRPLLPQYADLYTPFQNRRHLVKPGITGWAQVKGRSSLSWEKQFEYDVWYVDNRSLMLDLKVLWLTVYRLITEDKNSSKRPHFKGSG